jgi:tetratricopeptide (TPR) repeat protein
LGIVNQALRGNRELPDAWLLKTGFLNSIGYNSVAADMLNDVISKSANAPFRILMLEERSFLRAESLDGVKALRSADAALKLGSNSIRTHYLRGRSLALLGRLREAREEMNHVLALDPNHADAQRARAMIDEASPPTSGKKWWQFWKL